MTALGFSVMTVLHGGIELPDIALPVTYKKQEKKEVRTLR